jgi:hypothetical protein
VVVTDRWGDTLVASVSKEQDDGDGAEAPWRPACLFPVLEVPEFKRASYEAAPRTPAPHLIVSQRQPACRPWAAFSWSAARWNCWAPSRRRRCLCEMHWCCHQIESWLAASGFATPARCRARPWSRPARYVSRIEAAEEELFIANRRLIVSLREALLLDRAGLAGRLPAGGSKALANAVRKFDFTRGTPFYSYSQKAIQNRLRNFFRDHVRAGSFGIRPSREMLLIKGILDTWRRDYGEEPDRRGAGEDRRPARGEGRSSCASTWPSGSACLRRRSRSTPPSTRMAATCTS